MDSITLLVALGASFLAVISQLLTGFGFAMVLVPLLMLRTAPAEAVVISAMIGALLTTVLVVRDRHHVHVPIARSLTMWSIAGLPVGVLILNVLPPAALKWTIIIVVAVIIDVIRRKTSQSAK